MKTESLKMGLSISTETGAVLRPTAIQFSVTKSKNLEALPHTPFKYFTDVIIGLSYHKLTDYSHLTAEESQFAEQAYKNINPYLELYKKSAPRVQAISTKRSELHSFINSFENRVQDLWQKIFATTKVDLSKMQAVLDVIADFETQLGSPLLYNFKLQFSKGFTENLVCFYSMLFHLRSVVAMDHNAYVEDSSIESVTCDSISDYLPKADYTVNDALLYWNFKKLTHPFVAHKDRDIRIEKLLVEPLQNCFNQFNHNACCLVDQLPANFLNSLSPNQMEEALHHVQMDWLLGSGSGLLFKVREELFGLTEGYDRVFWPEASTLQPKAGSELKLNFQITQQDLTSLTSAA